MTHPRRLVSDNTLDRLRNEADGYSDFIEVILDKPDSRYGGAYGRAILISILEILIGLTGSEDDAIAWLFNSRGYTNIVQDDVCVNLAEGGFWTLVTLQDWLRVIEAYQAMCPDLIEAVFRSRAIPAAKAP